MTESLRMLPTLALGAPSHHRRGLCPLPGEAPRQRRPASRSPRRRGHDCQLRGRRNASRLALEASTLRSGAARCRASGRQDRSCHRALLGNTAPSGMALAIF